jgi:hypothetical protein
MPMRPYNLRTSSRYNSTGYWYWYTQGPKPDTLAVATCPPTLGLTGMGLIGIGTYLAGYFYTWMGASLPYPDSFILCASIWAQFLLSRKILRLLGVLDHCGYRCYPSVHLQGVVRHGRVCTASCYSWPVMAYSSGRMLSMKQKMNYVAGKVHSRKMEQLKSATAYSKSDGRRKENKKKATLSNPFDPNRKKLW